MDRLSGFGAAAIVVAAAVAIVLVTVFVLYRMRKTDLRSYDLTTRTVRMYELNEPLKIDKSRVPATVTGTDFSYSFWVYVAKYEPTADSRVVFFRGGVDASNRMYASPVVLLDKSTNSVHVMVSTTASDPIPIGYDGMDKIVANAEAMGWSVATIEYLPLQRWVHVAFVVKGAKITVYLDGDMYTVESTAFLNGKAAAARRGVGSQGVLPASTRGDVYVGKHNWPSQTIDGSLTKLQFYNYAVSAEDARTLYLEGPIQVTLTSRMGLPAYGVQTPIYRTN